jgi:hypothetical protein
MKKKLLSIAAIIFLAVQSFAQVEPSAGTWKTWFITSAKDYRLPFPSSYKNEIAEVISRQQDLDSAGFQQIRYWSAGAPGYRWQEMMNKLTMSDTSANGAVIFAGMLVSVGIYDATVAAWDTKYTYNRPRPFAADKRINALVPKAESPSYPCEYSVAAGVAVTVISHAFPSMKDSLNRLAQQLMNARIAAGAAFPTDSRAGFELGKLIAEKEVARTKDFTASAAWDRKMPQQAGVWKGNYAMFPMAGHNKTVVLDSASQFRPGPPPDFAKDMEELKNFKPSFRSQANAFFWGSQDFWNDVLNKKIFEYNLHLNPPMAARLYALAAIGLYDGFVACWDAKYTYWGIRPNQYDTTFRPPLLVTPPFPGYPSGHAAVSGLMGELYGYFFPAEKNYFRQRAKDGAESRFQAGIHFRTDNEVGLDLGRKISAVLIQKAKNDGADKQLKPNNTSANAVSVKHGTFQKF